MRISKKELLKRVAIIVAAACVLSYTFFHIASLFGEELETIVVGPTDENESIMLDGYIFRDSSLVNSHYSGAVDHIAENGGRVAVGDKLAKVYSEGNYSEVKELVFAIDAEIALLEESTDASYRVADLSALKESASNAYYSIMKKLSTGSLSGVASEKDRMLSSLNSIRMLTDAEFDISGTVDKLYSLRESLIGAGGDAQEITAQQSGYFYSRTDGYEGLLTEEAALNLDGDALYELMYLTSPEYIADNCIGALSEDSVWYFCVSVDGSDSNRFEENNSYEVEFLGDRHKIDMTLIRKLDTSSERDMLVFRTNVIPKDFGFERRRTVNIELESRSGIYIPKSAVHRERAEYIVYILKGSVVQARRIEIVYAGDDYYLARDKVTSEGGIPYLQSNDLLIVKGSNLFDGRILD